MKTTLRKLQFNIGISLRLLFLKKFRNVKHNFGNEIHDKQNNYENNEFHQEPNVLKSMSVSIRMQFQFE